MENIHAGVLLISTRRYKQFVQPLLDQLAQYFLDGYARTVFVFTDEEMQLNGHGMTIEQIIIPPYKFPFATLYRYKCFSDNEEKLKDCSHMIYLDVDMGIESAVSKDILCDGLTVVYHPGFYSKKELVGHWGSNGVVRESLAWIEPEKRFGYVAGGFNAGKTEVFLEMAKILSQNIKEDEANGVIAEHNDESHLNAYLKNVYNGEIIYLTPSYCLVQEKNLREAWGISELKPIIIALAKNHNEIRS